MAKASKARSPEYSESYQNFISQVSLYSHANGWVAHTQLLENKYQSEIAVVQQLVAAFAGAQLVFTLDALHAQTKTVPAIDAGNNEYVITLKANQPTLWKSAQHLHATATPLSEFTQLDCSHNRCCRAAGVGLCRTAPPTTKVEWLGVFDLG